VPAPPEQSGYFVSSLQISGAGVKIQNLIPAAGTALEGILSCLINQLIQFFRRGGFGEFKINACITSRC
jgi:hypothetical protein